MFMYFFIDYKEICGKVQHENLIICLQEDLGLDRKVNQTCWHRYLEQVDVEIFTHEVSSRCKT